MLFNLREAWKCQIRCFLEVFLVVFPHYNTTKVAIVLFFGAVVQTFPNRRNTSLNRCQIPGPSGLDNFGKESKKYRAAKRQKTKMQKHFLN